MATEYLDIRINTQEGIPIQIRVPIDTTMRDKMLKLHVTNVELIHTLSSTQMRGIPPMVGGIDKFKIGG